MEEIIPTLERVQREAMEAERQQNKEDRLFFATLPV